jgi:hypothetical protein
MSVRSMSKAMLVSLMLMAGSSTAYAAIIDFEDVAAGTFGTASNFATGGSFQVDVDSGNAIVDVGTGAFAAPCGGDRCSDNGTQALYVFDSGKVTVTAPGFLMNVTSFDAAIATVNDALAFIDPSLDFTANTSIRVRGAINANFGGGFVTPAIFDLSPPGNESFVNQLLPLGVFSNLDSISFEFYGASTICDNGCSGNFAIDNIQLTTFICDPLTPGNPCSNPNPPPPPGPGQVPEPSTLALVGTSLSVLLWRRRREKRRSQ